MKYNSRMWVICISTLTFMLGVILTVVLISPVTPEGLFALTENIILITSFMISFVAFVFSMITYFSIDSVNNITSMEGSVLENENYSIAYEEQIVLFAETVDKETFKKSVMEKVAPFKKSRTCMEFADKLQRIQDYIIWFSYIDITEEEKNIFKNTIQKEQRHYSRFSNGVNHLLEENVKLICEILTYQVNRKKGECAEVSLSKIDNVRGTMLRNPISQILYYNYLGLDYRRKALEIALKCKSKEEDDYREFSVKEMKAIMEYPYSKAQREQFKWLIQKAEESINLAAELVNSNLLWKNYVSYNTLRVEILKYLMKQGKSKEELLQDIDNVLEIRRCTSFLYRRGNSYLNEVFQKQVDRVMEIKGNFEKL